MPKNVCVVLIIVLAQVLAVMAPLVYFAQSPSGKAASSSLPISEVVMPSLPNSTRQNASTPAQDIGLLAALFAVPLILVGYLFYKCRLLVHKSPLFFRG